ncbi:hypothetical protein KJ786_01835 [Patescibacteria group bacterium]|nr:hypothetical protein [Patescibacteria group bacterium]
MKIAKANCVEICLSSWDSNGERMLSLKTGETFDSPNFHYRSLHLPDVNDQEPEHQLAMTQEAVICCDAIVALTHPLKVEGDYPTKYYEKMIFSGVPLAIENMDSRKDSGFNLTELERLVKVVGCLFVLDVQHAYEHDSEMKYAGDLLESLENHLVHLHVSGETESNIHSLVYRARNTKKIVEFIGKVLSIKNIPLILEGEYTTTDELRQEIEFLTRELSL